MADGFPILRLPLKSLMFSLRTMESQDVVSFSFTSKASKCLVEMLNMKAEGVNVELKKTISLEINPCSVSGIWFEFSVEESNEKEQIVTKINLISVRKAVDYGITRYWNVILVVDLRDFIDHILDIFHLSKVSTLYLNNTDYHYQSVIKDFNSLNILTLWLRAPSMNKYHKNILEQNSWQFKELIVRYDHLESQNLHSVYCYNFERIDIFNPPIKKLDSLLVFNIPELIIRESLPLTDFRIFFKHWICGLYRRLKYLLVYFPKHLNCQKFVTVALNGIKYQLTFADYKNHEYATMMNIDIQRNDGVYGEITLNSPTDERKFMCFKVSN